MSGHSKWSTIKRKKAAEDSKRGAIFTKIIKEITVAAREGGGDETSNPRLRQAISNARNSNMPSANIEKAIKKGTGELPGVSYEEATYEGYGPGGAAILLIALTDNKNRTVSEIRHILSKSGGSLAGPNSVSWIFEPQGLVVVSSEGADEDEILSIALEAGADDMRTEAGFYEIITDTSNFEAVKSSFEDSGFKVESAQITQVPSNTTQVEREDARKLLKLMEELEEHEDVQHVYSNFDIDESIIKEYTAA